MKMANIHIKLFFILIITTTYFTGVTNAQTDSTYKAPKKQKDLKFLFGFDSRISWILDSRTRFDGVKIGVEYLGKDRVGIGFYAIKNPIVLRNRPVVIDSIPVFNGFDTVMAPIVDTLDLFLDYRYTSIFLEHIIVSKKKYEITVPMHLGGGQSNISYFHPSDNKSRSLLHFGFLVTEISITGHYKIFPWIGIGSGIGYRSMVTRDKDVKRAFDAPIIVFKLKLFLGDLYRGIFPKKEKE